MDGEELKRKNYKRFLGIAIGSHLTYSHHVDHIIEKTRPSADVLAKRYQKIVTPKIHSEDTL